MEKKLVAENEMMHFHGKDKIKITVNRPYSCSKFIVNSELYLNLNISANVELDNKNNKSIVSDTIEKKLNVDTCNFSNELKMQNYTSGCEVNADKCNSVGIKKELMSAGSPSRKRLSSPKYVSPGKRKKTFPQQRNTMFNYLNREPYGNKNIFSSSENMPNIDVVSSKFSSENIGVLPTNSSCPHCSERISDKGHTCSCPDIIVLSSDDESETSLGDGSNLFSEGKSEILSDLKMRIKLGSRKLEETSGNVNVEDSEHKKSLKLSYVGEHDNIFKKEIISNSECSQIITISSDEDDDSPDGVSSKVIDLTCDVNDDDDDVYVYQNSVLEKRTCVTKTEGQHPVTADISYPPSEIAIPEQDTQKSHVMCSSEEKYEQLLGINEVNNGGDVLINHGRVDHSWSSGVVGKITSRLNFSDSYLGSELYIGNNNFDIKSCEDLGNISDSELPSPPFIPSIESHSTIEKVKSCSPECINLSDEEFNLLPQNKSPNLEDVENEWFHNENESDLIKTSNTSLSTNDPNLHTVSTKVYEKNVKVVMACEQATSNDTAMSTPFPKTISPVSILGDRQISNNLVDVRSESGQKECVDENIFVKVIGDTVPYSSDSEYSTSSQIVRHCVKGGNSSQSKLISAEEICSALTFVLYAKIIHPWVEMGAFYTPQCALRGALDCNILHGKKRISMEQEHFDENFLLEAVCPSSAIELLQRRIDIGKYPSSSLVQHALFCVMEQWNEIGIDALLSLNHLLHMHPPCAYGMLDYYKKVFFTPIENTKAISSDGIFWYCLTKIEQFINNLKGQPLNPECSPGQSPLREEENLENIIFPSINQTNRGGHSSLQVVKLDLLFNCLDYFNDVFEADLNVGLLKNVNNPKRYISRSSKPLIAHALWANQTIGPVNYRCKQLIKLYFLCINHFSTKMFSLSLNRLISMMAAVIYASERNTQPPKYPNVGPNCKDFSSVFTSILMSSDFNLSMADVSSLLNLLKPDWFRWSVCCSLLEKMYGRNMDLALQPVIGLLKNLWAVNQELPSMEMASSLLISETENESSVKKSCQEISDIHVKNATRKDKKGETRLHITCRTNRYSEVENLLKIPSININEKDNLGWTPLHEASCHGSIECVKLLLNHRTTSGGPAVDIRAKNFEGVTPLMDAVLQNHLEVAAVLLEYGGRELLLDTNVKGNSAWDLALTEEMKNILNKAPDNSKFSALSTVPIQLRLKLVILVPQLILFYIKFSEVKRITTYLTRNEVDSVRTEVTSIKFRPLAYKQDYKELKMLQDLVKQMLISNFGLVDKLIFLL